MCQALSSTVSQQETLTAQISEHCETDTNHFLQCHQRRENYKLRKYPGGRKALQFFEKTNELTQPEGLKSFSWRNKIWVEVERRVLGTNGGDQRAARRGWRKKNNFRWRKLHCRSLEAFVSSKQHGQKRNLKKVKDPQRAMSHWAKQSQEQWGR